MHKTEPMFVLNLSFHDKLSLFDPNESITWPKANDKDLYSVLQGVPGSGLDEDRQVWEDSIHHEDQPAL